MHSFPTVRNCREDPTMNPRPSRTPRSFQRILLACSLVLSASAGAQTATAPPPATAGAPMKLVIAFPPGGALDSLARAVAEEVRASTGEAVIVENRPGASTRIAIDAVRTAPPDGKTVLLAASAPFIIFPMTYRKLSYDVDRDFVPVAHLVDVPTVVSTGPGRPYKDMRQYLDWVRAHPSQASVGLTNLGGALHFAVLALAKSSGVPLTPVAYKGGAPLATDLVGGHIPLATDALASQIELHKAGKLRILGVSGTRRNRALPDVPTIRESGIDAFDHANASYSAYVPAGTPRPVVERLERALIEAVKAPKVQEQLARIGLEPTGLPGAELQRRLQAERAFWKPVVEASGFRMED